MNKIMNILRGWEFQQQQQKKEGKELQKKNKIKIKKLKCHN